MNLTEQLKGTLRDLKIGSWNATSWYGLAGLCCGVAEGISVTTRDQELAIAIAKKAIKEILGFMWAYKLDSLLDAARLMDDVQSAYFIQAQVVVGKIVLISYTKTPIIDDLKKVMTDIGPRIQTGTVIDLSSRPGK